MGRFLDYVEGRQWQISVGDNLSPTDFLPKPLFHFAVGSGQF
jgi:hypothetical protein